MPEWESVEVWEAEVSFNAYGRALYRKCNWCGRDATHYVRRTSGFSGNTYTDPACEEHAAGWSTP